MIFKKDFIYNIYWVTHMTDGVMDDIVWIHGTRMSWFNTMQAGSPEKKKTVDILYMYYISYI